ncbi:MAG: DUF302 domain-containing protein [Candidatus Thiodiazotropha sp. (ex Troendleina suluensis)]|nr:DUF302 domain-containing protein [Candidatus Thiodiazotropha sp. (ex Troendleina suluensis)]
MNTFRIILLCLAGIIMLSQTALADDDEPTVEIADILQTVIKMSLKKGVSIEDAGEAMTSKASELNLKLVGRQKVHEEVRARGKESPHLEILQFCTPEDAVKMVMLDPVYAAYMPCRISMVEDANGKAWLYMLNLDMLINSNTLPPELQAIAIRVNQAMLAVMTAGATGEF